MFAVTIALYYKEIEKNLGHISQKLLDCVLKFNWDYIDFPVFISDYKIFEKNNEDVALNILYVPYHTEEIRPEYISKYNFDRKNHVTLLKITDGKGTWHFSALKGGPTKDGFMRPRKHFSRLT